MKKFFSISLIAIILFGIHTAKARTGKNECLKTVPANNAKSAPTADPKSATTQNPTVAPIPDTGAGSSSFHFYKPKKKRFINLQDIYVGVAGGFLQSGGSGNTPFHKGLSADGRYGIPLINKYLLLEFNNSMELLFAPDMNWFEKAYLIKRSRLHGLTTGFDDEFSLDLQVVIAGSRKLSLTAGPLAGARMTNLPSMVYDQRLYHLSVPVSVCYGLKANLFIGDKFYCYAQYSDILAHSLTSYASQVAADEQQFIQRVPVEPGLFRIGAGYVLKPWW